MHHWYRSSYQDCTSNLHVSMQERLDKKAVLIAGSMRKFLAAYWTARQAMLDEEAAKKLVRHGALHGLHARRLPDRFWY